MDSPEFAAFIEALETQQRTPECLSDEAIAALASGHVSREQLGTSQAHLTALASSHVSRAHLRTCLLCLQAYASLRGLMEVSGLPDRPESDAPTVQTGLIGWLTSAVLVVRRFLSTPVPLGWSGVVTASVALLVFFVVHEPQRGMMSATEPSSPSSLEELSSAQQTQAEQEQREQKTGEKLSGQPVRIARAAEQRQAAQPQQRQAGQEHPRSARRAPAEIGRRVAEKLQQPVRVARETEKRQAAEPQQRQAEQEHLRSVRRPPAEIEQLRRAHATPVEIERRVAEKLQQAGLPPKMVDAVSPDGIVTLNERSSIAPTWQQDDLNRLVLQVPGVTGVMWRQSAKPSSEIARPSRETGQSGRSESAQSP